ncbi:SDR family NAD(P)-dependent oxidoreductase [Pseudooceanicola sp. 216_PA32_1]|uniref:SDR family NAD(P)-dependent oxidoreductase n=1 Tax=Pseudooceanicola pacificus TaxID=2676438 RepID=A0A844WB55_9RHOB|nr:SDR family NAD(P)-dependent oxidoreductase [Pseudooceanicola pacificus]MWB78333.1 SDR family NAD(P)-dependent oxidoreductase [Pseudooceanicola pacificus]
MDFGLDGKVVVVTGGSSGIGFATAKSFHDEGAIVVINGRDEAKLAAATAEIGPRAKGVVADLTTAEGTQALHAFAEGFGPVAVLVNNIGRFDVEEFQSISDERWHEYFDINVMTGIRITRPVLKSMLERDAGSVIFIASEAAIRSIPFMVHYSVTKTAQLGLSRALAEMTRGTNVRVNTYLPGPTATQSVRDYFEEIATERGVSFDEVMKGFFENDQPGSLIQRLIDPEMHGRAIVQLATNTAMNGTTQRADGGAIHSIL